MDSLSQLRTQSPTRLFNGRVVCQALGLKFEGFNQFLAIIGPSFLGVLHKALYRGRFVGATEGDLSLVR